MQAGILDFIDRFLPKREREAAYKRLDVLIRLRTIVCVLALSLLIPFSAVIAFFILHLTTGNDFSLALLATGGILVLLAFQHLTFQSFGDIYRTASAYAVNFFFSMVLSVYYTGGWQSPCLVLLFCCPIMTFMIASRPAAQLTLWATLIIGMIFFSLDTAGIHTPQIAPTENLEYIKAIMWIMACIILLVFLYTQSVVIGYLESNEGKHFKTPVSQKRLPY